MFQTVKVDNTRRSSISILRANYTAVDWGVAILRVGLTFLGCTKRVYVYALRLVTLGNREHSGFPTNLQAFILSSIASATGSFVSWRVKVAM